jgi:hypothetical protein
MLDREIIRTDVQGSTASRVMPQVESRDGVVRAMCMAQLMNPPQNLLWRSRGPAAIGSRRLLVRAWRDCEDIPWLEKGKQLKTSCYGSPRLHGMNSLLCSQKIEALL